MIVNIFLSSPEPRLRSGWRLLCHSLLMLFLLLILAIPIVFSLILLEQWEPANVWPLMGLDLIVSLPAITLATWIARRLLDRRSFQSLGLHFDRHTLQDLLVGFAIPGLLMGLIFAAEVVLGWLQVEGVVWETSSIQEWFPRLMLGLVYFMGVGFQEELLSRGYHLQNLAAGTSLPIGVTLSSAVFALLHLRNPSASWLSTIGIFLAGIFFAYAWVRTRRLWLPIGLHIGWNFFEGIIFGFPVSGLETFRLLRHSIVGPILATGGPFGPEAGLIVLPALALGTGILYLYTRRRQFQLESSASAEVLHRGDEEEESPQEFLST